MLQLLLGILNPRVACPTSGGPPKGPAGLRVSATRHGVTGTNVRPEGVCELKPIAQPPPLALSQFCWIRNCLPLKTTLACAPFSAAKVEPKVKAHKSPFSPAV